MAMTDESQLFGMMQTNKPLKMYIKTVPSVVYVNILDPFSGKAAGTLLKGNPRTYARESIVEIWSEKEDVYFQRANRKHIETGVVIPYTPKDVVEVSEEERINSMSDEEMEVLLKKPFFSLQSVVNKTTSPATLFRMLEMAKDLDRSEKTISLIEGKLAELNGEELS